VGTTSKIWGRGAEILKLVLNKQWELVYWVIFLNFKTIYPRCVLNNQKYLTSRPKITILFCLSYMSLIVR